MNRIDTNLCVGGHYDGKCHHMPDERYSFDYVVRDRRIPWPTKPDDQFPTPEPFHKERYNKVSVPAGNTVFHFWMHQSLTAEHAMCLLFQGYRPVVFTDERSSR